jgi:hypothetical protein
MEAMLRWVNFGRRLPPKVGHFCTPANNHPGFTGTGAGKEQQRAFGVQHRRTLLRIQFN